MSDRNGHTSGPEVDFARTPPNDPAAERVVLGTCLAEPTAIDQCAQLITGVAFYDPRHQQIWHAIRALAAGGYPTDPVAVLAELRRRGEFRPGHLDAVYLHELHAAAVPALGASYHAGTVAMLARQRRLHSMALSFGQYAARTDLDTAGLDAIYAHARELLDDIAPSAQAAKPLTLEELIASAAEEEPYDWVVPSVLERHDRLMVTGPEGGGKTTLLRQFGVQVAAGIHPFTGFAMPPATVLHVDLENSKRQTRRRFGPLHAAAGAKQRPIRPYGASLWLRWPEFGIHLADDGAIAHWRGGRDERKWPTILTRGGEWPWTPATDERAIKWQKIKNAREEFGEPMTIQDVVEATGIPKTTAYRVIGPKGHFRDEWTALNGGAAE